jgi:hypothetical protein
MRDERAAADEILGRWYVTYGSVTTADVVRSPDGYDFITLLRVRPTGARCWIPQGTLIRRVRWAGSKSYAGWHSRWWEHTCAFAQWSQVTLILSPDSRCLSGLIADGADLVSFSRDKR